jgi:hypothetical protein
MATVIHHPGGALNWERDPSERFDIYFTREEIDSLRGEIGHDIYLGLYPDDDKMLEMNQPEELLGSFAAETTACDERLSVIQRFHYRNVRLRSLLELFE